MDKKISIFGAGYVGMSLAVLLAQRHTVNIFDVDISKIKMINMRKSHLEDLEIKNFLTNKKLHLKASLFEPHRKIDSDFTIIAVPTSFSIETENFDTSIIETIVKELDAQNCKSKIIIKSTVPLGFTDKLSKLFPDMEIIYSPEFLREGKALYDNLYPSRIVVGSSSITAIEFAEVLSSASEIQNVPVIYTNNSTAEAIKLGSNTYLAMRVAFFNELDTLAFHSNINAADLISSICFDNRIGEGYNNPSFAYGGYCLPKDVKQLTSSIKKLGLQLPLIEALDGSNEKRLLAVIDVIQKREPKTVGIYRLQMKSGSDNAREAANARLAMKLLELNMNIQIYEPSISVEGELRDYVVKDLQLFLNNNQIIVANRWGPELESVAGKVICRDIYNEN